MSPMRLWQSFWFPLVPVRRLAAFRIAVVAFALISILSSGYMLRYARVDQSFYHPLLVLRVLRLPQPGVGVMTALYVLLIVALVCALIGLMTRLALWVAAPLYTWWFATFYSFGKTSHNTVTIVAALFVLAIGPAGKAYALDALRARRRQPGLKQPLSGREDYDELAGWALRVVMVLVVLAYVFSAYAKLRTSGLGWISGGAIKKGITQHQHPGLLTSVLQYSLLVNVMMALTLAVEATAWLAFFRGRIRDAWVVSAVLFHLGSFALLGINFLGYVVTYLAFYDLEVAVDRLRPLMARAGRRLGPARGVQLVSAIRRLLDTGPAQRP
jgi:hypothetical protein